MKIAIFTNNYLPNPYGVSMSIESFRKELEKNGHTVFIFAPKFKGHVDENPNVFRYPSIDLTFRGIRFPIAIPFSYKMDRILKNLDIDIIHAQHPNLLGWQAKRWAKKKKIPLIFTWHTLYDQYAHFVPLIPKSIAAWWSIGNARRFADKASHIIVPTLFVKEIIKSWGVKNTNITNLASGIDETKFIQADRNKIRSQYQVCSDEILILLVCRLTAEKNIDFIFDSLMPLFQKNTKLKFLVVGGGNKKEKLEKLIGRKGLEKQIFFAGEARPEIIKDYYAAGDIFVYASKSETQGMILTEALYMGLPIVAVRAPGARDLVGNFVTGILTSEDKDEFQSAVLKLINDQNLRCQYSENAKKVARENYTSSVCAKKMLETYNLHIENKKDPQ